MNKASFIRFRFPLKTTRNTACWPASGDKGNMQELIQAKSFGGSGLSCLIDLEGDMIISPTNSEPFLRLDDIFMKNLMIGSSAIYIKCSRICRPIQGGVFTFNRCRRDRISFVLQALMRLRLGIVDTGARESDFV